MGKCYIEKCKLWARITVSVISGLRDLRAEDLSFSVLFLLNVLQGIIYKPVVFTIIYEIKAL